VNNTLSICMEKPNIRAIDMLVKLNQLDHNTLRLPKNKSIRSIAKEIVQGFNRKHHAASISTVRKIASWCGIERALTAQRELQLIENLYRNILLKEAIAIVEDNSQFQLFEKY